MARGVIGLTSLAAAAITGGCAASVSLPERDAAQALRAELPRVVNWDCGGLRVDAWRLASAIELVAGERQWRLPRVRAASGARYADGTSAFWSKGPANARLSLDGAPPVDCAPSTEPSAWTAAAARGARFRAVGIEPDWSLEYTPGEQFLYLRPGQPALRLPAVGGGVSPARGGADGRTIEVETLPGSCGDGMSDLAYEFGVRVRLDGAPPLAGCGRALY
jgi:uncharacterized membrane protein/membrane-bound inhibitor of C-type lysozyme